MDILAHPPLAARWARAVAELLDSLVGGLPIVAAVFLLGVNETIGVLAFIATICFSVGYYFLADAMRGGQSLGKRALDIAVVHAQTGAPCSPMQSFLRNLLLYVLGPIDWVFIFGERRQRLGDKLAGTIVVEALGGVATQR